MCPIQDINLLRYFTEAKQLRSHINQLPEALITPDVKVMLKWFQFYFKKYPEDTHVNVDKLSLLMKLDSGMDKETFDTTKGILDNLRIPIDLQVKAVLMEQLEEKALHARIALLAEQFANGDEVDFTTEVLLATQESMKRRKVKHQGQWEDGDVWEMVKADADNSGYLFTFLPRTFYMQIKGLNAGDNICVAAPTNKGKTSFLINCAVDFAKQRLALYAEYLAQVQAGEYHGEPMEFRPVLVLINEGNAKRITPRVYQTALGCDREQMFKYGADGVLEAEYIKVMGRRDAVRLVNVHGLSVADVMKVIEAHNPFCVITDMTGRIKAGANGGMNDTAQLEHVWNSMREFATMFDFIHIGTVQLSADGFDTLYPTVDAVQNSKVGIQTTWDLAIFIGAMLQPAEGAEGQRGISTPKSKLARVGCNDYIKEVTYFDPQLNTWKVPEEN